MIARLLSDQTFWVALQAIGTLAAFGAILWQVYKAQRQTTVMQEQTEAIRATTGYDLLLRLEERFGSAEMRRKRSMAASRLIAAARQTGSPAEYWKSDNEADNLVGDILDFFELVGLLVTKRALDADVVWSQFSTGIVNYYLACTRTRYFDALAEDPTVYEDVRRLYERMQAISRERNGRDEEEDLDFMDSEASTLY